MSRRAGYEYLDHVSDVRIRAWGSSHEETFTQACLGMWALIAGCGPVPSRRTWTVTVSGAGHEELLVNLLNEQILMLDSEGLAVGRISSLAISGERRRLCAIAKVRGALTSELAKPLATHVKAATYSGILVLPTRIDITLDV